MSRGPTDKEVEIGSTTARQLIRMDDIEFANGMWAGAVHAILTLCDDPEEQRETLIESLREYPIEEMRYTPEQLADLRGDE